MSADKKIRNNRVLLPIRGDVSLKADLSEIAKKENRSFSNLCEHALGEFVKVYNQNKKK